MRARDAMLWPWQTSRTRNCMRSQARSLLSTARLKRARSRHRRNLKSYANRPYLLEFEWRLLAYELSLVPRLASGDCSAGLHDRLLLVGSFQFASRLNHGELSEVFSRRRQSLTGHFESFDRQKCVPVSCHSQHAVDYSDAGQGSCRNFPLNDPIWTWFD